MDDLISRSSVLKGIEELQKSPWYNYGKEPDRNFPFPHLEYIARKEAVIVIHDLCIKKEPAVDAAPVVHGRWTERHVDYASDCAIDEVQTLKCSACGLYHTTPYLYSFTDYKFCPNCGAQMDGGKDDE